MNLHQTGSVPCLEGIDKAVNPLPVTSTREHCRLKLSSPFWGLVNVDTSEQNSEHWQNRSATFLRVYVRHLVNVRVHSNRLEIQPPNNWFCDCKFSLWLVFWLFHWMLTFLLRGELGRDDSILLIRLLPTTMSLIRGRSPTPFKLVESLVWLVPKGHEIPRWENSCQRGKHLDKNVRKSLICLEGRGYVSEPSLKL